MQRFVSAGLLARSRSLNRRLFSGSAKGTPAIVFDIDGVLLRGYNLIPRAREALKLVTAEADGGLSPRGLPHIFVTNGGGVPEKKKADHLSELFGIRIRPEQIVLAHTPMRDLVPKYGDSLILAMGRHDVRKVAENYGFKRVITPTQLMLRFPNLVPHATDGDGEFSSVSPAVLDSFTALPFPASEAELAEPAVGIRAILVFSDPRDWYRDMQLALDVLMGHVNPQSNCEGASLHDHGGFKIPHIYFSNPDFVFTGKHTAPRLAQGAFASALEALYKEWTGNPIKQTFCGKPYKVTYDYAEKMLQERAKLLGFDEVSTIYGIGDNPRSDIRGANSAGDHWRSVLVRSGVIAPTSDPRDKPDYVCDDVLDAVNMIYSQHGMKPPGL